MLSPLHLPLLLALPLFPSHNAIRAQGDASPLAALCTCHAFAEMEEHPGAHPACRQAAGVGDEAVLELP